eukprot:6469417-Karenia_brevis.AAC.1
MKNAKPGAQMRQAPQFGMKNAKPSPVTPKPSSEIPKPSHRNTIKHEEIQPSHGNTVKYEEITQPRSSPKCPMGDPLSGYE